MIFRPKTKATYDVVNDASLASAEKTPVGNGVQNEPTQTPVLSVASIKELSAKASDTCIASSVKSGVVRGSHASAMSAAPGPSVDEIRCAIQFARITSLLMRSPHYKHYTLADLEYRVIPATLLGQCVIMDVNANGRSMPVAAAFWALVSEEVDKRLSTSQTVPIRLRADEWRTGNIVWLVDVVGDNRAFPAFLKHLQDNVFKGKCESKKLVCDVTLCNLSTVGLSA